MARFETTRWSVFLAARSDPVASREALVHLCTAYRRPVLAYIRRRGHAGEDAEDLAQSFFAALIERRIDTQADPQRGRFRALLLSALQRFLINADAHRLADKRGGGMRMEPLDDATAGSADGGPEQSFDLHWALTVVDRAVRTLRLEAAATGRVELFDALREYLLEAPAAEDYARLANATGMRANTLAVAVHRLRQRFRQQVREELAETVGSEVDVDAEFGALREALGGRRPTDPRHAADAVGERL